MLISTIDVLASKYIVVSSSGELGNNLPPHVPLNEVVLVNTLDAAHVYIQNNLSINNETNEDITIFVRGGIYYGTFIEWQISSQFFSTTIQAYPDERPVFDGRVLDANNSIQQDVRRGKFLSINKSGITKITIEGLKIANYRNAISINGLGTDGNSYNKIIDCIFYNIGTKYYNSNQDIGYSAVGLINSSHNEIRGNVFSNIENRADSKQSFIHAIYLQEESTSNTIIDNYINLCSGDPIKLRDGSDNNTISDNYAEFSGLNSFILDLPGENEEISNGTILTNNTILFPYPFPWSGYSNLQLPIATFFNYGQPTTTFQLDNFIYGDYPQCGKVVDMVGGDTNDDGIDEVIVAVNYSDISVIVKSQPSKELFLSQILYVDQSAEIGALIFDDFNNDGVEELITALNLYDGGVQIMKGDGVTSISNHGLLFDTPFFKVNAFASGDFDNDGVKELITGFNDSDGTQIHRGNGEWSIGNFGLLYNSNWWKTSAFATGDFNQDGDVELVTAFHSSLKTQIHKGNGEWSVGNLGILDNDSTSSWYNPRMTASDFDNDGDLELVTIYNNSENTQIVKGNGETSTGNLGQLYQNVYWKTSAVTSGDFDGDGSSQLVTAFVDGEKIQIHLGNGVWSVGNQGKLQENWFLGLGCSQHNTLGRVKSSASNTLRKVHDEISENVMYLFPNPTEEMFVIHGVDLAAVRVFDLNGRLVLQIDHYQNGDRINVGKLLKGNYLVQIYEDERVTQLKLIID